MGDERLFLKRYEKKFLLSEEKAEKLLEMAGDRLKHDQFFESKIRNIYFDTPDFLLIRRSMEHPVYKEKLRLRTYEDPNDDTKAFCEIKKKFEGVVYKRRISMPYAKAYDYLTRRVPIENPGQISREIDRMFEIYDGLEPRMYISYSRQSYYASGKSLRVTFDRDISWRSDDLDSRRGMFGNKILPPGIVLLEVKAPGAMPAWFAGILSELGIYKATFSKYANSYRMLMGFHVPLEEFL